MLDRATFFVVNRMPIGTMDAVSWEDTSIIMSGWLQRDKWDSDLEPGDSIALTAYAVDATERLLTRLIYEKATTRKGSVLRHEQELVVAEWQAHILNAFISVAKNQTDPRLSSILTERSEAALRRIVEWFNKGGYWLLTSTNQDPLPVQSFVRLCRLWLQSGSSNGFLRGSGLLLLWTDGNTSLLEKHKSEISSCFNEAMNQYTYLLREQEVGDDCSDFAARMTTRMDFLRESGWTEIDEVKALARKIVLMKKFHASHVEASTGTGTHKSRGFENSALLEQMTELIGKNRHGKELEKVFSEWVRDCRDCNLECHGNDQIYLLILQAYQNHMDAIGAVDFAERQLAAGRTRDSDAEVVPLLIEKAIEVVARANCDNMYNLMVTRLFRNYGMDESLIYKFSHHTWRRLMHACEKTGEEEDFASIVSIMALTELRRNDIADDEDYWAFMNVHLKNEGPKDAEVFRVAFHGCCKDGCLHPRLKNAFIEVLGEDFYTSQLEDGREPEAWTAKVRNGTTPSNPCKITTQRRDIFGIPS